MQVDKILGIYFLWGSTDGNVFLNGFKAKGQLHQPQKKDLTIE